MKKPCWAIDWAIAISSRCGILARSARFFAFATTGGLGRTPASFRLLTVLVIVDSVSVLTSSVSLISFSFHGALESSRTAK